MESNHQPADYKSAALPIEPHQHIKFSIAFLKQRLKYTKLTQLCQQKN